MKVTELLLSVPSWLVLPAASAKTPEAMEITSLVSLLVSGAKVAE